MKKHSAAPTGFNQEVIELPPDPEEDVEVSQQQSSPQASSRSNNPSEDGLLASLIFVIALPTPTEDYSLPDNPATPLLLYTLPRSVYEKPLKNAETGKRPKEKTIKKIQRSWQKSIRQAEDIRRGDYPRPSWMKKIIGGTFWFVAASLRFITISDAQMLARLPPIRKIGPIQIIYSQNTKVTTLSETQAKESLMCALSQAQKQAKIRAIISGCFLPAALVAEIYVPLIFEITLVYFVVQWRGWKKAKFLVEHNNNQNPKSTPAQESELETGNATVRRSSYDKLQLKVADIAKFQKINELVYRSCSEKDPLKFPRPKENTSSVETPSVTNPEIDIDCATVYQCTNDTKPKNQSTDIKSIPGPDVKADIGSLRTPLNTGILRATKQDFDGMVITIPASDEDNETDCREGGETKKCATPSLQVVDIRVEEEFIITGFDKELAKTEPPCNVAISAPSTADEVLIPVPPCVVDPICKKPCGIEQVVTCMDGDEETGSVLTREITQSPAPPVNQSDQPKAVPNMEIASALISLFKESLPSTLDW
ncbi:hypothetical protein PTTG_12433 [Puccinia triticina 1-1 BBBD Race 1]|uniref:Uncharacterized protein n=1 Tax=Puccinia triticina (isolate 1-1 / race 1 (BBBD)) TaxID=630390 RepID=A0A180G7B9_PUCT1|nr:hypothetical protein PTTG_12433 [Puccinia triticina 1-1 BBBD Race 1]